MGSTPRLSLLLTVAAGWLLVESTAVWAGASSAAEGSTAAEAEAAGSPRASQEAGSTSPTVALPQPGSRVRVYTVGDDDEREGVFVGADGTSLRILQDGEVVTVKRDIVRHMEVATAESRPTNGKRIAIGSLIGGAAGLGIGGTAAYVLAGGVSGDPNYNAVPAILVGVAAGAAVGGLIAHATRGRGWSEVPLARVQLGILPTRRGVHVALAIRF